VTETTDKVTKVTKFPDGLRVAMERTSVPGFRPVTYQTVHRIAAE
jgi:hypothetical protein